MLFNFVLNTFRFDCGIMVFKCGMELKNMMRKPCLLTLVLVKKSYKILHSTSNTLFYNIMYWITLFWREEELEELR